MLCCGWLKVDAQSGKIPLVLLPSVFNSTLALVESCSFSSQATDRLLPKKTWFWGGFPCYYNTFTGFCSNFIIQNMPMEVTYVSSSREFLPCQELQIVDNFGWETSHDRFTGTVSEVLIFQGAILVLFYSLNGHYLLEMHFLMLLGQICKKSLLGENLWSKIQLWPQLSPPTTPKIFPFSLLTNSWKLICQFSSLDLNVAGIVFAMLICSEWPSVNLFNLPFW